MSRNAAPPKIYSDRETVEFFKKSHSEIFNILNEKNIGKVHNKQSVHFCGLANIDNENSIFFLPRQTITNSDDDNIELAKLTMRVLARYGKEAETRKSFGRASEDKSNLIALIQELAVDFKINGIYAERIQHTSINNGKPNWSRTLSRTLPIASTSSTPIYSDIITNKHLDAHESPLATIQAAVMREIISHHSWWLDGLEGRINELHSFKKPKGDRQSWIRVLNSSRQNLYASRPLFLVKALVDYLSQRSSVSDGSFLYGVEDFQFIWEQMLRKTLNNVEVDWNSKLPKPGFIKVIDGSPEMKERGMQTDIITRTGKDLKIIDAKYYEAIGINSVPGWSDIVKQLFYEKAVKAVDSSLAVTNYFVFPISNASAQKYSEVRMYNQHGSEEPAMSKIKCQYINTSAIMNAYVKRQKVNFPSY